MSDEMDNTAPVEGFGTSGDFTPVGCAPRGALGDPVIKDSMPAWCKHSQVVNGIEVEPREVQYPT